MAVDIRRDIIVALRGEYDPKGLDAAFKHLDALEKRVQQLNSRLRINIPFAGTGGAASNVSRQVEKISAEARSAASSAQLLAQNLSEAGRNLGKRFNDLSTIKRQARVQDGDVTRINTLAGPGGLTVKTNQRTGDVTATEDLKKASRERQQILEDFGRSRQLERRQSQQRVRDLQDEASSVRDLIETENERIRRRAAVDARSLVRQAESEKRAESLLRDRANADNSVFDKRRAAAEAALRDRANAENVTFDKRSALAEGELRARANIENQVFDKRRSLAEAAMRDQANLDNIRVDRLRAQEEAAVRNKASLENAIFDKRRGREEAVRRKSLETFENLKNQGFKEVPSQLIGVRPGSQGQVVQDRALINDQTKQVVRLNAETGKLTASQVDLARATGLAGDSFLKAAGKVALWSAATGAVFGVIRGVSGGIRVFTEFEEATIALERVGRGFAISASGTAEAQDEIAEGAQEVSAEITKLKTEFGSTGTEAQEAAVIFARLGLSQREVLEGVRVSLLAANVAGIGAADAAKFLTAAMSQFQLSVRDLPDALNKLNTLENTTRVRTDDLLQAISRGGAVFREAGGTFEEFAGTVATIAQNTGRSGAEIGNALKTIVSNMADVGKQDKVFASTGVAIRNLEGQLKPVDQVLAELVKRFVSLSDAEKAGITTTIAGIRQRNILQTALDNYFQIQGQVIRQLTQESSAAAENEQVMGALSKRFDQLLAALEELAVAIGGSGLGAALKTVVSALTFVVRGITEFVRSAAFIPTIVVAGILAVVLSLNRLMAGFSALIGFTNASVAGLVNWSIGANAAAAVAGRLTGANSALAVSYQTLAAAQAASAGAGSASAASAAGLLGRLGPLVGILAAAATIIGSLAISGSNSIESQRERFEDQRTQADSRVKLSENRQEATKQEVRGLENAQAVLSEIIRQEQTTGELSQTNAKTKKQLLDFVRQVSGVEATITDAQLQQLVIEGGITKEKREQLKIAKEQVDLARRGQQAQFSNELGELAAERQDILRQIREAKKLDIGTGNPDEDDSEQRANRRRQKEILEPLEAALKKNAKRAAEVELAFANMNKELANEAAREAFEENLVLLDKLKEKLKTIERGNKLEFSEGIKSAVNDAEKLRLQIDEQSNLINKLKAELEAVPAGSDLAAEIQEQIKKATENTEDLRIDLRVRLHEESAKKQLDFLANDLNQRRRELERDAQAETTLAAASEKPVEDARERLRVEKQILDEIKARARELEGQAGEGQEAEFVRVRKLAELRKLEAEQAERVLSAERDEENIRKNSRKIRDAEALLRLEQRRAGIGNRLRDKLAEIGATGGDEAGRGVRVAQALAEAEARSLQRLQARRDDLLKKRQDEGLTNQEKAELATVEGQIQDSEAQLEERKATIIERQLDLMIRQTEERQKQIEQTRKEIGGMSDIELVRTRILAGRIASGDAPQLTEEQFLTAGEETRRQLTKFQELFPGTKIIPDINLGLDGKAFDRSRPGADVGDTAEILRRAAELNIGTLDGTIQNATIDAGVVQINGADIPEQVTALPPAGAGGNLNVTARIDGIEAQMNQLAGGIATLLTENMQALIDANVGRVKNAAAGFKAPVRT